jgi:hypothetical protein
LAYEVDIARDAVNSFSDLNLFYQEWRQPEDTVALLQGVFVSCPSAKDLIPLDEDVLAKFVQKLR